jgi:DNA-binding MarR family transcriptional regulator
MAARNAPRSRTSGGSPAAASREKTDYASQLERASRGLLSVSMAAISQFEQNISPTHLRALQALDRLGACKVGDLAEALDLAPSSASRLSDRLAEAGLITRAVAPDNRRATQLELTPDGHRLVKELVRVRAEMMRQVSEHMTERDRRALLRGAQAFSEACLTALHHAHVHAEGPAPVLSREMCLDSGTTT